MNNNENNTDQIINDLCDWIEANGLNIKSNSKLKLIKSTKEEEGRCVKAVEDLGYDQVLVEMPNNFVVNYRFAFNVADIVHFFKWHSTQTQSHHRFNRLDAIYFFLMIQRLDKQANMNKFAESMPTSYDTPEYFDQCVLDSMPHISLRTTVTKRLDRFKRKYELIVNLLDQFCFSTHDDSMPMLMMRLLRDHISYDLYKWAFCSVNSRCFHLEESDVCSREEIELAESLFGKLASDEYHHHNYHIMETSNDPFDTYMRMKEREDEIKNNLCCLVPFLDFLYHSYRP